jgi:serine/threonine-protein kinase HipA
VAFYKTKPDNTDEELREIPGTKIANIIDRLVQDPLLTSMDNPPRLSLAGAQSKFAMYKSGGKYYRSDDRHPTTHIIKITNKRFLSLLHNELFCMRLAKIMQLDIPDVQLMETDERLYLEITRYDRRVNNDTVIRIHQEDFCQALGIVSGMKYQAGGGASLRACYRVINTFSENRLTDTMRFIAWILFNFFIGNTDAHAKNLSLLHDTTGIRLAPFYDLLSTEVYPEKIVDHGIAMLINGKGKYDSLKPRDFITLFENLGLNSTNMMKAVKGKFAGFISAAENLRENLTAKEQKPAAIYDAIIAIIRKRTAMLFG